MPQTDVPGHLAEPGHWSFDDTRVEVRHDSRAPAHHPERDPQPPSGIGAPRS